MVHPLGRVAPSKRETVSSILTWTPRLVSAMDATVPAKDRLLRSNRGETAICATDATGRHPGFKLRVHLGSSPRSRPVLSYNESDREQSWPYITRRRLPASGQRSMSEALMIVGTGPRAHSKQGMGDFDLIIRGGSEALMSSHTK